MKAEIIFVAKPAEKEKKMLFGRKNVSKKKVCRNCKEPYIEGDKYCRYCGAPMGKPSFIEDDLACLYGPPVTCTHVCEACGFTWKRSFLGSSSSDKQRFCPQCGGKAPVKSVDDKQW